MYTVGDIRKALEGVSDDMEVIVQDTNTGLMLSLDDAYTGRLILVRNDETGELNYSENEYFWFDVCLYEDDDDEEDDDSDD